MSLSVQGVSAGYQAAQATQAGSSSESDVSFADVLMQAQMETEAVQKPQNYSMFSNSNMVGMMGALMQGSLDGGVDGGMNDILSFILVCMLMNMENEASGSGNTAASNSTSNTPVMSYAAASKSEEMVAAREKYQDVVESALTRLGDPYSQPKSGQGDYTDCSYLSRWAYRSVGLELPRTAAAQAQYCVERGQTISKSELKPGDLIFFSLKQNGRFMNISHVGIYAGDNMMVDASSSYGQVVYRPMFDEGQVLYARPKIPAVQV